MKNIYFLCIIASLALVFTGCTPTYYIPNSQNVPLLSHAGEYNVSITGTNQVAELQASVSPVKHLGVQLDGSWFINQYAPSGDKGNGFMADAGVGYYKSFGVNDHFVFETYAIGGVGGFNNTFVMRDSGSTMGTLSSNFARYGIQPSIGYKSQYFDVAVSSRFVGLSYFNTSGDLVFNNINQFAYVYDRQNSFLIEPALTIRAGVDFFKFQFQVMGSFNTLYPDFYQRNLGLSVGFIVSPNRYFNIFKKQDIPELR